jgi:tRNA(Ile)-lysidine synthase
VVTGHTASDRAETLLLNLARGCHRRGLASLGSQRPLGAALPPGLQAREGQEPLQLVRPLLLFSRNDTARICRDLGLPVLEDPSNQERRFARNRLRAEVMPVLEALHPGAERRIAALAQRLEEELHQEEELLMAVLEGLRLESPSAGSALARAGLARLGLANRRRLLALWLRHQGCPPLAGQELEELAVALEAGGGPGQRLLAGAWLLRWDRCTLVLLMPGAAANGHG